jgi:hypothetical protein
MNTVITEHQINCNSNCINWLKIEVNVCIRDSTHCDWHSLEMLDGPLDRSYLLDVQYVRVWSSTVYQTYIWLVQVQHHRWLGTISPCNCFRRLFILKDKEWHGAKSCYSSFSLSPFPLYVWPPSVQQVVWIEGAINPKSGKNILNSKLEQFMACILHLINRIGAFEFSWYPIFFDLFQNRNRVFIVKGIDPTWIWTKKGGPLKRAGTVLFRCKTRLLSTALPCLVM